jgi:hypothetical protein
VKICDIFEKRAARMVAERQDRYPKSTYKILYSRNADGNPGYYVLNLATGLSIFASSIWEMLKSMESDLSANKFPQSVVQYRAWGAGKAPGRKQGNSGFQGFRAGPLPESGKPTFVIRVLYRQNATWQGSIQWIEASQARQYRSMNELLSLMDEAERNTTHESNTGT